MILEVKHTNNTQSLKYLTIGIFRHEIFAFHYRDPERKAGFLQKNVSHMD